MGVRFFIAVFQLVSAVFCVTASLVGRLLGFFPDDDDEETCPDCKDLARLKNDMADSSSQASLHQMDEDSLPERVL